ncbi:MAG: UDP-N-acetylmuramate dehydrogenase [Actinomycetes bacterium]
MTDLAALEQRLGVLGEHLRRDVPIGPLTTYRVGGPARWFVDVVDAATLSELALACAGRGVPVLVVGRGSNLLVADGGFDGLVVQLGDAFAEVTVGSGTRADGLTVVRAGGAAALPVVARRTVEAGLTGFEWSVGVPGSIGGAVRMNAGGHGSDMAASLVEVRVVDLATGEDVVMPRSALQLNYRSSAIGPSQVVVHADLALPAGDREAGAATLSEIVRWRRANQPGGQNAGSVFTNPAGDSAGRLIDTAGCRGLRVGTAEVSSKHANFIQADAGGSADDIVALMVEVARRVRAAHGVTLHPETRIVGFAPFADMLATAEGAP